MTIRSVIRTAATMAAAWLLIASSTAGAQEFVKVDNATREQLPAPQFVGAAYGFIWLAILAYVVIVARGLARTRTEIDDLKRRVDRLNGESAGGVSGPGGAR